MHNTIKYYTILYCYTMPIIKKNCCLNIYIRSWWNVYVHFVLFFLKEEHLLLFSFEMLVATNILAVEMGYLPAPRSSTVFPSSHNRFFLPLRVAGTAILDTAAGYGFQRNHNWLLLRMHELGPAAHHISLEAVGGAASSPRRGLWKLEWVPIKKSILNPPQKTVTVWGRERISSTSLFE